jgi:AAA domain
VGCIIGGNNVGKSAFFQSIPECFIFNLDNSIPTSPTVRANLYPPGPGYRTTFDEIKTVVDSLIRLAAEGKPRPKTVVFDSLTELVPLITAHLTDNGKKYGLVAEFSDKEILNFEKLDGRKAWPLAGNMVRDIVVDLARSGYGVWVSIHPKVIEKVNSKGETEETTRLAVPDSIFSAFKNLLQLCAVMYSTTEVSVSMTDEKGVKLARPTATQSKACWLAVQDAHLEKHLRAKTHTGNKFPSKLLIPHSDGWSVFAQEYRKLF